MTEYESETNDFWIFTQLVLIPICSFIHSFVATMTFVFNPINWYTHFRLLKACLTTRVRKQGFGQGTTTFCNGCAQHTDAGPKQCRLPQLQLRHHIQTCRFFQARR